MCDCLEEKLRKERERARRAAAGGYGPGGGGFGPGGGGFGPDGGSYGPDGTWHEGGWGREPPPPRFSPLQIVLGSTGFLLAMLALLFKTVDNEIAHSILSKVGLGHLVPPPIKRNSSGAPCIPKKRVTKFTQPPRHCKPHEQ